MTCIEPKHRYKTEAEALVALENVRASRREKAKTRRNNRGVEKRAYHCPWCDHWHLTHKSDRPLQTTGDR